MQYQYRYRFRRLCAAMLAFALAALPVSNAIASSGNTLAPEQRPTQTLCRPSLRWHVADVDPRFNLSRWEFRDIAMDAAQIWNDAVDFELFRVSDDQGIAVSLIYDHRQALQEYIVDMREQIARISEQVTQIDTELQRERDALASEQQELQDVNQQISQQADAIDAEINQYANRRGQVPRDVAQRVNLWQDELQQLIDRYNADIADFNQRQAELNNQVSMRNTLAAEHAQLANEQSAEIRRTQAQWQRDNQETSAGVHGINIRTRNNRVTVIEERIDVYTVRDKTTLFAVLAHEFGHAVGIGHVQGAHSIMSAQLEGELADSVPRQLSRHDLNALDGVCE